MDNRMAHSPSLRELFITTPPEVSAEPGCLERSYALTAFVEVTQRKARVNRWQAKGTGGFLTLSKPHRCGTPDGAEVQIEDRPRHRRTRSRATAATSASKARPGEAATSPLRCHPALRFESGPVYQKFKSARSNFKNSLFFVSNTRKLENRKLAVPRIFQPEGRFPEKSNRRLRFHAYPRHHQRSPCLVRHDVKR